MRLYYPASRAAGFFRGRISRDGASARGARNDARERNTKGFVLPLRVPGGNFARRSGRAARPGARGRRRGRFTGRGDPRGRLVTDFEASAKTPAVPAPSWRRPAAFLAKALVAAVCLWYSLAQVSWGEFVRGLQGVGPGALVLAALCAIGNISLVGLRWSILLAACGLPRAAETRGKTGRERGRRKEIT